MARKIATVYEADYCCGHSRQITLSVRPGKRELTRFKKTVQRTKTIECIGCAMATKRDLRG